VSEMTQEDALRLADELAEQASEADCYSSSAADTGSSKAAGQPPYLKSTSATPGTKPAKPELVVTRGARLGHKAHKLPIRRFAVTGSR
jgi:hypothetical protein